MTSYVTPKKNSGFIFFAALVSQANTKTMQSNPAIAAGDFKVSIDGGALANLGTLPAVTPAASVMVKFTLSAAEMNGDNVTVVCVDAAGAEWCDAVFNIQTSARQIDDLAFPATSGRGMVVDANGLVDANTVKVGPTGSGAAQTAGDIPALVVTATGYIDTEVAAIKTKTDNLPASPAATGDAMTLTAGERNSAADALLARNVSGGSSAGRTVKQALHVLRNKTDIAAGTLTVYDVDDATPSFTATVTTTAGNPISQIDPA